MDIDELRNNLFQHCDKKDFEVKRYENGWVQLWCKKFKFNGALRVIDSNERRAYLKVLKYVDMNKEGE